MNFDPKHDTFDNINFTHFETWDAQLQNLLLDIQTIFSNLSDRQYYRLANSILIHQHLEGFFARFPQETEPFQLPMQHIQKNLNYEKPFRIAVVAVTGQGKSTLLNALLSRNLVVIGDMGGAATGCAQQIFQDINDGELEYAEIEYRDEQNILELIHQHFIQRYNLDLTVLPATINEEYVRLLSKQEPFRSQDYEEQREFGKMRDALVDVARQFVRYGARRPRTFQLNNPKDKLHLEQLTAENSKLNTSDAREIGLIRYVNYHIKAESNAALHLPKNVCLVDLPGVGATQFHNLVIYEGIQDADAILFVVHPRRFDTEPNRELLDRARRFITLEDDPTSVERIFLVVNAKDEIMNDSPEMMQGMRKQADQFMDKLFPGSSQHCPRYEISAWAALQAQKVQRGETLDNTNKYNSVKTILGVDEDDPDAVWQASHVPLLIDGLKTFTDQRLDRQIREAESALKQILSTYCDLYNQEHQRLTQGSGEVFLKGIVDQQINEQLDQIQERLQEFRRRQLNNLESSRPTLERVASRLFDQIDLEIQSELPNYWKEVFKTGTFGPGGTKFARIMPEQFLGMVNVSLWQHLSSRIEILAQELADTYASALDIAGIPSAIASYCFDQIEVEAIKAKFQQHIDQMQQNMGTAVRGIVIAQLADPAHWLIPFSAEEHVPQASPLMAAIPTIRQREMPETAFDGFIEKVREHYSDTVSTPCITGLFNVYRYEIHCCEQVVINYLKQNFERMRLSNDPGFVDAILNMIRNEDLQNLELLEEKLGIFNYLKDRLTANHSLS